MEHLLLGAKAAVAFFEIRCVESGDRKGARALVMRRLRLSWAILAQATVFFKNFGSKVRDFIFWIQKSNAIFPAGK
jgi:hypothetical protein